MKHFLSRNTNEAPLFSRALGRRHYCRRYEESSTERRWRSESLADQALQVMYGNLHGGEHRETPPDSRVEHFTGSGANPWQEKESYNTCRGRCPSGCPDIPYEILTEIPVRPPPKPDPPEPEPPKTPRRAKRPGARPKVVAIGSRRKQQEATPEVGKTAAAFKPPQAQFPKLRLPDFKLPDLWWLPGVFGPRVREFAGKNPGVRGGSIQGVA